MLDKKTKKFLDSMPDDLFIAFLFMKFSYSTPIWERCTKEEYEQYIARYNDKPTIDDLLRMSKSLFSSNYHVYRRVPIWHNGGGILDQISGKEPDGYYYEKQVGTQKGLALGSDMWNYCQTRECMKPFFKK